MDCGPRGSQQTIELLRRYVDTIEVLVVSHNDADHDFNVPQVLHQYRKATKKIFFLQDRSAADLPQTLAVLHSAKEDDFPAPRRLEVDDGAPRVLFSEGGVQLSLLYPDLRANLEAQATGDSNQTSGVLRLRCNGRRVVFSGDATIEAWEYLAAHMPETKPLLCDIMTVPHHGGRISRDSAGEKALQTRLYADLIKPQYAVISVGTSNLHGHPKAETLNALVETGATILCTEMTERCCDDLEAVRFMRGRLASPSRSTRETTKTQSGRSRDVACFGSVVAEVSHEHLLISGLDRYMRDVQGHTAGGFNPACRR